MTFFLIVVLCLAIAVFVFSPLRAPSAAGAAAFTNAKETVGRKSLVEKQRALSRQIQDLEFDNSLEKINGDDFNRWRNDLNEQLTTIKSQLSQSAPQSEAKSSTRSDADFDVETEILVARARRQRAIQSAVSVNCWTCSCGRAMSDADRFCASCGAARS